MNKPNKSLIYPLFIPNEACPGGCIYCDQSKISHAGAFDLEQAQEDVQAFIRRNPNRAKEVAFYGGTFTALPVSRQEALLEGIHALLDDDSSIRISTHPLYIDDEVLERCKAYRVKTIELGIQDFCELPLQKSGRNYSTAQALAAAHKVRNAGFILGLQLMPGMPGSDAETIKENHRLLRQVKPDLLRLYPLVVIRGTPLQQIYQRGEYTPLSLPEAVRICADYAELCEAEGIRIIKYGLPSNLEPQDYIAGPFHPAFGELVKQELLIRKLNKYPEQLQSLGIKEEQLLRAHACQYLQTKRPKTCKMTLHNQSQRS
ncbi:MAG: radical SAM protein [Candidatus Cloacimonetes bacterium]|jgi:histone acetyltransferase (RNA polymerase elongator complex component)|nr:radical SAM protein [Candidatus Cloacimonadota bacterium]MDD3563253.1 radical SAM protein [Candidatus Cloacimonadota bacterium]MDD4278009.1 radical SAM protein [Candidatus Cloacimonadota bacterium]MDY0325869.1 radical SAM protein [Candidatus Cloacimonadaceae bacterium]